MKRSLLLPLVASLDLLCSGAGAQTVATDPVGFSTNTLLSQSDSAISIPFVRPPAFVGEMSAASGNTITVSGSPFNANQFVYQQGSQPNRYYVLIGSASVANPKEGHTYPVLSNTANTLTVDVSQDNLTGIPANAQVSVIPNWTLATAFPASDANVSFTPTNSVPTYKTQIRVPDTTAPGINLAYAIYYFSNNAWHREGDDLNDRGDDPLLPDSFFVVRNLNGAPTLPFVSKGSVVMKKFSVPLMTSASTQQDNPVSLLRPLDIALNATGLNRNDGSFVAGDQLLLFNNAVAGYDKAPLVYTVDGSVPRGPWRLTGDNVSDRGVDVIPAGTGFVIRKAPALNGATAFWTQNFPVQAIKAVSRKTHGSAGDFDRDLPLSGTPAIECRGTGTTQRIVFTFPAPVSYSGVAATSGTVTSATATTSGVNEVIVDLNGVTDAQRITVTLLDVSDGTNTNDVAVRMGILAGDTSSSGIVNGTDVSQTKAGAANFTALTASNFRQDVNLSGTINASDIGLVKAKSGSSLPAAAQTEVIAASDR